MTPNKEDYLKALFTLGGRENLVSNKSIAEALDIAPASVTEMLGKLKREGIIHYEPYKGSRLTEDGTAAATMLVRGHRLWEVFLIRHLGYSWSEAHEDAELLEHITPPRLAERLDRFLNYPAYCPHGYAIPQTDGQQAPACELALTDLGTDTDSEICRVTEDAELMDHLQDLNIEIGMTVRVLRVAPLEGPLTVRIDDREVQLSDKAAGMIFVQDPVMRKT